jgi:putative oxidoreductase
MSVNPFRAADYRAPVLQAIPRWRGIILVTAERYAPLLGRILLGQIFLISGVTKIMNWTATEARMVSKVMPLVPLFLLGAIVCELVGGLSLLLGCKAQLGALLLFLFLIPTTLVFHNFWRYEGMKHKMQMINFMKNLAIMGGLAVVMGFGPGPLSIDRARGDPVA